MDDLAAELQILAKDATMKVRRYMRGSARFEAMVSGGFCGENDNRETLTTWRFEAYTAAFKRDAYVRDCEWFLQRLCQLMSADWRCWQRSLQLKTYATDGRGWNLKGRKWCIMSVGREETSGDLLGFYNRLEGILEPHGMHEGFQAGDYNYVWDPAAKFTLRRLNLCDNQIYPWFRGKEKEALTQIGYEGMGRRGIRRGTITTSRFTALCQGSKKVAYIEVDGSDGTDLAIMECTAEAFERKFGYNEINGFQWESGW